MELHKMRNNDPLCLKEKILDEQEKNLISEIKRLKIKEDALKEKENKLIIKSKVPKYIFAVCVIMSIFAFAINNSPDLKKTKLGHEQEQENLFRQKLHADNPDFLPKGDLRGDRVDNAPVASSHSKSISTWSEFEEYRDKRINYYNNNSQLYQALGEDGIRSMANREALERYQP